MERTIGKIYTIFIILMPILNIYAVPQINSLGIGEAVGIILILLLCFCGYQQRIVIHNLQYWIFILYLIIISIVLTLLIPSYSIGETVFRILKTLFYTCIIFGFSHKYLDMKYFKEIYLIISFIASIYLIIQYICHVSLGVNLPVTLPNMNLLNLSTSEIYNRQLMRLYAYEYRPSGFFTEPAHFCQYVIYSLPIIFMHDKKKEWHYIVLAVVVTAVFLSGSAIGYICIAVMFAMWLVMSKRIQIRIFIFFLIIVVGIISIEYGYIDRVLYRLSTINAVGATTGTVRLLRGIMVFVEMPLIFKVFGIGAGNYGAFVNEFDIVTMFDSRIARENEYMNTISMILVYGGIIGLTLFCIALYNIFKKAKGIQIMCFAILLLLMVSSNVFYSATYVMPMILVVYKENYINGVIDSSE